MVTRRFRTMARSPPTIGAWLPVLQWRSAAVQVAPERRLAIDLQFLFRLFHGFSARGTLTPSTEYFTLSPFLVSRGRADYSFVLPFVPKRNADCPHGHNSRTPRLVRMRPHRLNRVFKVDVPVIGKQHLRQGSLARLPWSHDRDNSILASYRLQPFSLNSAVEE